MSDPDRRLVAAALGWAVAVVAATAAAAVGGDDLLVVAATLPPLVFCARAAGRRLTIVAAATVPVVLLVTGLVSVDRTSAGRDLALVTVLVVLTVIGSTRMPAPSDLERRRDTMRSVRRLHRLIDDCQTAEGLDALTNAVAAALTETLHLRGCWYEPAPVSGDIPEIDANGDVTARVQHRVRGEGLALPPLVALPVAHRQDRLGRFVLEADPALGITPERRVIAVAMADVAALAADIRHPR